MCTDKHVSKRSKTDNHLYRLQSVACSAYVVSESRSEREMTAEGWKRKSKGSKEKRELKRNAVAAVKAHPLSTGVFTQVLHLDSS